MTRSAGQSQAFPAQEEVTSTRAWKALAHCRDLPLAFMFPTEATGVEVALRICAHCPVRTPCLNYALSNRIEHGVWGGASEQDRRQMISRPRGTP
jgi:WhiB family transcriptional regulator, redox-sensing transcriptional regulator